MSPWLLMLIPIVGAIAIFLTKAVLAKWISLGVSLLVFVISILMAIQFEQWGQMGIVGSWCRFCSNDARVVDDIARTTLCFGII